MIPQKCFQRAARKLTETQFSALISDHIDILGIKVPLKDLEYIEVNTDVVCNGSGTSLTVVLKGKILKIHAGSYYINEFFKHHLGK